MAGSTKVKNPKSVSCNRNGCQSAKLCADLARHMKLTDLMRQFFFCKDFWDAQDLQEEVAAQLHKVLRDDAANRKSQAGVLLTQIAGEFPSFKENASKALDELRNIAGHLRALEKGECDSQAVLALLRHHNLENGIGAIMRALSLLQMIHYIV